MKRFLRLVTQLIILLLPIPLLMSGCREKPSDARLLSLYDDGRMDLAPLEIVSALDSIDVSALSGSDRKFYELLRLKAEDKAYVEHKSDTVILSLVEYYKEHPYRDLYPEALYYAGRVYSDMGDYPTSLRYFQSALDALPENTSNLQLKGVILSQTGRLLSNLRLYDEALRYLNQLEPIIPEKDTLDRIHHYQALGWVYMYQESFSKAMECLDNAMEFSLAQPDCHVAKTQLYKACVYYEQDSINMALCMIRGVVDRVLPMTRNLALATAADIYQAAGYKDTAYTFARELISSESSNNKRTGYRLILSPELRNIVPKDSLPYYYEGYKDILEEYFNENERDLGLMQQASYNYNVHKREKERIALENLSLRHRLLVDVLVIAVLVIGILALLIFRKERNLRLWRGLDIINQLRLKATLPDKASKPTVVPEASGSELRERRRKELQDLAKSNPPHPHVSLLNSEVYSKLQTLVKSGKPIGEDSDLWNEMEEEIKNVSPNFKSTLRLLTDGRLTSTDYETALLIKFGITPTEMSILVARALNSVSTRRNKLCSKIFDEKQPSKLIDSIILLL